MPNVRAGNRECARACRTPDGGCIEDYARAVLQRSRASDLNRTVPNFHGREPGRVRKKDVRGSIEIIQRPLADTRDSLRSYQEAKTAGAEFVKPARFKFKTVLSNQRLAW